jgi:predicted nucleic acid-binding protein
MSVLLDSNVLIYRIDRFAPNKQARADHLIRFLQARQVCHLSSQRLSEYANITLKKFALPAERISRQLQLYQRQSIVHPVTAAVVLEALRGVTQYQLAFYDAQIWAVAKLHQLPYLLSEDFNSGANLEGVEFINPFDSNFDPLNLNLQT